MLFKQKIEKLLNEFGIKQEALILTIGSNRVDFGKKLKDNSFTEIDKQLILAKYGSLLS